MIPKERQRIVERNLNEIYQAIEEYRKLCDIDSQRDENDEVLDKITHRAFFNSIMGHISKVLDLNRDKRIVGFWYLYRRYKSTFCSLKSYQTEKIEVLTKLADQMQKVRNVTLAHIGKLSVLYSKKVWGEANIESKQVENSLKYLHEMLHEIYDDSSKKLSYEVTEYPSERDIRFFAQIRDNGLCSCE